MKVTALGQRDGWRCWLCGQEVDPAEPAGSPHAGSVDHVVPRAVGGGDDPANLRLAHRRCNGRRGSAMPELVWPARLGVLDGPPLWQALLRLAKRPRTGEVVATLGTDEAAAEAAGWVEGVAASMLGGDWNGSVVALGAVPAVRLTCAGGARDVRAFSSAAGGRRPGRQSRRRSRS